MLKGGDSSVIQRALLKEEFDADRFIGGMDTMFPNISTAEKWIRSGIHIPQEFKTRYLPTACWGAIPLRSDRAK